MVCESPCRQFVLFCALLITLWARSCSWRDEIGWIYAGNQRLALLQSHPGRLSASLHSAAGDTFSLDHYSQVFNTQNIKDVQELTFSLIVAKFRIRFHPRDPEIGLPYSFLVALSAFLGALPWVPWSKRFSLRTLLIAATFVAVILGMIACFWS